MDNFTFSRIPPWRRHRLPSAGRLLPLALGLSLLGGLAGCDEDPVDPMTDAGRPPTGDGGVDAGPTEGADAGADGGTDAGPGDTTPPTARIAFPLADALALEDTMTLHGTAEDASGVAAVRVDGVEAISDDGFATWTAEVTVPAAARTTFTVEATDAAGNVASEAADVTLTRTGRLERATTSVYHPGEDAIYYVLAGDEDANGVYRVSLATRLVTTISRNGGVGSGPPISDRVRGMALDATGGRLFLGNQRTGTDPDEVLEVDLADGSRRVVADNDSPGTDWANAWALAWDEDDARIILVDNGYEGTVQQRKQVFTVDPSTGARTLVAGGMYQLGGLTESGGLDAAPFRSPSDVALDGVADILFVADEAGDALMAIDIDAGTWRTVSSSEVGTGAFMNEPSGVAYDASRQMAYVWAGLRGPSTLFRVDVTTGARRTLSAPSLPSGGCFEAAAADFDPAGRILLGPGSARSSCPSAVLAYDSTTELPSVLTTGSWPETDPTLSLQSAAWIPSTSDLYLLDLEGRVDRLDLEAGAFAAADLAAGGDFFARGAVRWDPVGGRAIVYREDDRLSERVTVETVDPADDTVTPLSNEAVPNGDALWADPQGFVVDPSSGRIFVIEDDSAVIEVDAITGARTVLFDQRGLASELRIDLGGGGAWDEAGGRYVTADPNAASPTVGWREPSGSVTFAPLTVTGSASNPELSRVAPSLTSGVVWGLGVDADDSCLVGPVDLATRSWAPVSFAQGPFVEGCPRQLDPLPFGGAILMTDEAPRAVLQLSPDGTELVVLVASRGRANNL